jgi:PD-(D/E)XK endonuclease
VEHPKDIGDRSTLAIMSAIQSLGFGIYLPFGERLRQGAVVFALCSNYGHHRNPQTCHRDYQGQVDSCAVYCPETTGVYLIPIADVPGRRMASLRVDPPRNNQLNRVRFAADYEIGRVAIEGLRGPSGA